MKKTDLGKLGVAIGDHLDFGAFTAHGLTPLPHHKDAAGRRRLVGSKQKEKNNEQQAEADPKTDASQYCTVQDMGIELQYCIQNHKQHISKGRKDQ